VPHRFPILGVPVYQIWHGNTLGGLLGGRPRPTPRGWSQRSPILGFLSIYTYTRYYSSIKFDVVTHTGSRGGACFMGSAAPHPKGAMPQRCAILEFPFIYAYTLCCRTTKFDVVTRMGRGVFLLGQRRHCICTNASRGLSATTEFLLRKCCINC